MDLEEMDRRICGDLGKCITPSNFNEKIILVDKNRRLDELFVSQSLDN